MTLLSTKDDFLERSLAKVPGILRKLEYVSHLRENGKYVHWGLVRIYGEEAVQRALAEVHRGLFMEVLRTPVRKLKEDIQRSVGAAEARPYMQSLAKRAAALLPGDLGGGSESHFTTIIAALSALHR